MEPESEHLLKDVSQIEHYEENENETRKENENETRKENENDTRQDKYPAFCSPFGLLILRTITIFVLILHFGFYIYYFVLDWLTLVEDQSNRPVVAVIGNLFWFPLNLINAFLLFIYLIYICVPCNCKCKCCKTLECNYCQNTLFSVVQNKLFPGMFIYLLFIDTFGLALDLYSAHIQSPKDTTPSFLRAEEYISDIILIFMDFLLCIFFFWISGYGLSYDYLGQLRANFESENWEVLDNSLRHKPTCIFHETKKFQNEFLFLQGVFEKAGCEMADQTILPPKIEQETLFVTDTEERRNFHPIDGMLGKLDSEKLWIILIDEEEPKGDHSPPPQFRSRTVVLKPSLQWCC